MECVFTTVTGDTQLGQTKDGRLRLPRRCNRVQDVISIAIPIERRLIQYTGGNFDEFHVVFRFGLQDKSRRRTSKRSIPDTKFQNYFNGCRPFSARLRLVNCKARVSILSSFIS